MSGFGINIFSVCPSVLLHSKTSMYEFSSSKHNLIANFSSNDFKQLMETWNGEKLSTEQKRDLIEIIEFLEQEGAFISYKNRVNISQSVTIIQKVIYELETPNREILFGISEVSKGVHLNIIDFEEAKKRDVFKIIPDNNQERNPNEILDYCTSAFLKSNYYKIIDPYFFCIDPEMKLNKQKEVIKEKISLILEICRRLKKDNAHDRSEINIEVFGREGRHDPKKNKIEKKFFEYLLKDEYELKDFSNIFNISLYALCDKESINNLDGDFHRRYLYTDKFLFQVDNSFKKGRKQDRQGIWRPEATRDDIQRNYSESSDIFENKFKINISKI